MEVTSQISVAFLAFLSAIIAAFGTFVTTRWTEQRRAKTAEKVVDVAAKVEQNRLDQIDAPESVLEGWRELFATERIAMAEERKRWLDESKAIREAWEDRLASLEEKVMRMQAKLDAKDAELERCNAAIAQRDVALADRDAVIRRLRSAREVLEHAILAAGLPLPRIEMGDTTLAPERRVPTVTATAVVVEAEPHPPKT